MRRLTFKNGFFKLKTSFFKIFFNIFYHHLLRGFGPFFYYFINAGNTNDLLTVFWGKLLTVKGFNLSIAYSNYVIVYILPVFKYKEAIYNWG